MIRPRMLAFALCALLLWPSERSVAFVDAGDETNDQRSLLETVWGHPWYNNGVAEENGLDNGSVQAYNNQVGNGGAEPARGYYPVKPYDDDERSSSDLYHDPYYHGYDGTGKGYKLGWDGKGFSKKWKKSIKGSKGKKSKSSKSKHYKKPLPPKPLPPRTQRPRPRLTYTDRTIPNFMIAYVDPLVRRTFPTEDDFAELVDATTAWFERAVRATLPRSVNLVRTRSLLNKAVLNAGYPSPQFNILTDYKLIEFTFLSSFDNVKDIPPAAKINAILLSSINEDYLFKVVRRIPAFASVTEVYAESIENTFEPVPTISPTPTTSPSQSSSPTATTLPSPSQSSPPTASTSPAPSQSSPEPSTASPTFLNLVETRVSNFFIAYLISQGTQPSADEFAQLVNATQSWFEFVVAADLPEGVSLVSAESEVAMQVFDSLAPSDQPNLFIEYTYVQFVFRVPDGHVTPNESELLAIMQDSIGEEYLDQAVRPILVFASAEDAFLLSLDGESSAPTITPGPISSPEPTIAPVSGEPTKGSNTTSAPIGGGEPTIEPTPTISPVSGGEPTKEPNTTSAPIGGGEPTIEPTPTISPTSSGELPQEEIVPVNETLVRVNDVYLAYMSLEKPLTDPTKEDYAGIVEQTVAYFENVAADFPGIGAGFLSAEALLNSSQINAGIPATRFNIIMNYEYIDLIFEEGTKNLPSPADAFKLLRNSLNTTYLTDYVFTVSNSPFAFVKEFVMGQLP